MELFHTLLLFLFLAKCVISLPAQSPTHVRDELTLLAFKSAIGGGDPFGRLGQWNRSLHFCRWPGVTCGGRRHPERVRALDLSSLNLTGPIPPCLSNLTFLRTLSLNENQFYGPIPQELGHLSQLRHLNLSFNSLGGNIPATLSHCSRLQALSFENNNLQGEVPSNLSRCSKLQYIYLGNNMLVGEIPRQLGTLPNLIKLYLHTNTLYGGIPPSLGNLSSLRHLDLSENSLSGGIPPSLGKLSSLLYLNLGHNNLLGVIPLSIYNISGIHTIDLADNNLHGTIPKDIGYKFPRLKNLVMYENKLHGPLPVSLANASQLEDIALDYNRLSGTISEKLAALQSLAFLDLASNQFEAREPEDWSFLAIITNSSLQVLDMGFNSLGGTLPNFVANYSTSLTRLGLAENQISGIIPSWIWNLRNLETLSLEGNLLVGSISADIENLQRLQRIYVNGNQLLGEIPSTLGNLTRLNLLLMEGNYFIGSIPISLKNCGQLEHLDLSQNHLTGPIPKEVLGISSAIILDLSHNSLTGVLPSEVGSLINLEELRVNDNKLLGEIPSELGHCQSLEVLRMNGNLFYGNIPQSLSSLSGIQELDLSSNNLSGHIPEFLGGLYALSFIDLSFNNFEGQVPENGIFRNMSDISVSVLGNSKLCGGSPQLLLPRCSMQESSTKHRSYLLRLTLPLIAAVLCLILLSLCLASCYRLRKSSRNNLIPAPMKDHHLMKVSYHELLKATNGFSRANLIGVGSFSSVYKGILGDEQNVVAVKVINLQQRGALKNFTAECEALRNIRHRNLVRILTSCSSIDFSGNEFRSLIFDFMSNGSLERWLHPDKNDQHELRNLSLMQRLSIAMDVANAMEYLHYHGHMPVVHCDLKPSNILLDDEMVARVGDFGLARLLSDTITIAQQEKTTSSRLKGSIGYMAPEYGMANKVSTQGDVYSYGIILLEIFTGKRPIDNIFKEGLCLRQYVGASFSENLVDVIDPCLFTHEEVGDADGNITRRKSIDCIASMLRIGLLCTKDLPSDRINMGDVTKNVRLVIDTFFRI